MISVKPKVAFITNTSWFLHNFYSYFIDSISKKYDLHIITPEAKYLERYKDKGITFHYYDLSRAGIQCSEEMRTFLQLFRLLKKNKFKWVLNFTIKPNIYGSIAAYLSGSISYINITGRGTSLLTPGLKKNIVSSLFKIACICSRKVMFSNKDDLAFYIEENICSENKTNLVFGSGINTEYFQPSTEEKNIDFLFIGRMIADKGIRELIEASSNLKKDFPKINISLVGPIDLENPTALTEEELQSSQSTKYLGSFTDIREVIKKAKCVILPSYSEGFPRVLQEAGLMGVCQIATNVAGCKDLVIDEFNGLLCEPRDAQSLEKAMRKFLLLDDSVKIQMQNNARKYISDNFSEKIVEKQMMRLILN